MRIPKETADWIARKTRAGVNRSARLGRKETHIYGLGSGATVVVEIQVTRSLAETKKAMGKWGK